VCILFYYVVITGIKLFLTTCRNETLIQTTSFFPSSSVHDIKVLPSSGYIFKEIQLVYFSGNGNKGLEEVKIPIPLFLILR
jgi:hypothetical protein